MNKSTVAVQILGKSYQVKCVSDEVEPLKKAAVMVDEKMRLAIESIGTQNYDKIAVLTSLQLAYQVQTAKQDVQLELDAVCDRIEKLCHKIDTVLATSLESPHARED